MIEIKWSSRNSPFQSSAHLKGNQPENCDIDPKQLLLNLDSRPCCPIQPCTMKFLVSFIPCDLNVKLGVSPSRRIEQRLNCRYAKWPVKRKCLNPFFASPLAFYLLWTMLHWLLPVAKLATVKEQGPKPGLPTQINKPWPWTWLQI